MVVGVFKKEWKENSVSRIQDRKKAAIVELESSSILRTERSIAEWCMDRSSKKHSKREGQAKRCQKNIQNTKRSMVKYRSRKGRYI